VRPPAIVLREVTKRFRAYQQIGLKNFVVRPSLLFRRPETFLVLDRVSLEILQGESFGVIGRNGAGKSTLLGLIGGIYRPTAGRIELHGRVSPLLELGVGFTPELTGRENIRINGVLLGLRRREVEERIERIIDFADLDAFIDQPLKTYSSGMQSRLGFAIAVHVDPEILLVDEVLAVGDAEFYEKCLDKIAELRRREVTIVVVSHAMEMIQNVCDRAAWIDQGRLMAVGSSKEVVDSYRAGMLHRAG
jgi:ABC-type polysaccharide/polyol phosphate transport system ATPase subunit